MIEETYKGYGISIVATAFVGQQSHGRPMFAIYERRDGKQELVHRDNGDDAERYETLDAAHAASLALARKWIDERAHD
jgi:hypothetical protein